MLRVFSMFEKEDWKASENRSAGQKECYRREKNCKCFGELTFYLQNIKEINHCLKYHRGHGTVRAFVQMIFFVKN